MRKRLYQRRIRHYLLFVCTPVVLSFANSVASEPISKAQVASVGRLLAQSTPQTSFEDAKLSFDQIIEPRKASNETKTAIDRLKLAAEAMLSPHADDPEKLRAVRKVIYVAGPWNDNKPFSYDHDDPFGKNIRNRLLSTYINSRHGNCVSMPILFLILANRLGVNVSLSHAPLHLFVQYTDPAGHVINIETTSGGFPARDEWMKAQMPMTDKAIQNGIYMRTLTHREVIADMATIVLDALLDERQYEKAIKIADAVLDIDPRDALTIVHRGSAYGRLYNAEFASKYSDPSKIPLELRARAVELKKHNEADFATAEALGWQPDE